jgi:ADP-glucose pyrophosphorylase
MVAGSGKALVQAATVIEGSVWNGRGLRQGARVQAAAVIEGSVLMR